MGGVHPLTSVFLAAAGLLALAGGTKLVRSAATSQALRLSGLPSRSWLVRLLGAAEVLVAVAALLEAPFAAAALAATYAAFTVFVGSALLRGVPLASCGCFAEPDVPPSPLHVIVTSVLAISTGAVAAGSGGGLKDLLDGPMLMAAGVAGSAALVGWLTYLALSALPRLAVELGHDPPARPPGLAVHLQGGAS